MNRKTIIVLVALGAAVAGVAIASSSDRLRGSEPQAAPTEAARPQKATLGWREVYGQPGEQIVFTVDSLEVTKAGWRARVGVENRSKVGWELVPGAVPDGTFGIALFETGDAGELDQRNRARTLPAVRAATSFDPELVKVLEPNRSWEGSMSARGSLVARSWARVVFGTLVAIGKPPDNLGDKIVWITDSAYELRR